MVSNDDQLQNFSTDNVETKHIDENTNQFEAKTFSNEEVNYEVKNSLNMVTDCQSNYDPAKQNVDFDFKSEANNIPKQNKPNDVKEDTGQQQIDRTEDGNQKIIS